MRLELLSKGNSSKKNNETQGIVGNILAGKRICLYTQMSRHQSQLLLFFGDLAHEKFKENQ